MKGSEVEIHVINFSGRILLRQTFSGFEVTLVDFFDLNKNFHKNLRILMSISSVFTSRVLLSLFHVVTLSPDVSFDNSYKFHDFFYLLYLKV